MAGPEAAKPDEAHELLRGARLVAALLVLVGGAALWFGTFLPALEVWRARSWVATPVTHVRWELDHWNEGHVWVEYDYVANGLRLRSHRYAFRDPTRWMSNDEVLAKQDLHAAADCPPSAMIGRWARRCPAAMLVHVCYVDPADPRSAVLVRDLPRAAYNAWGGLVALLGVVLFTLRRGARRSERGARALAKFVRAWPPVALSLLAGWLAHIGFSVKLAAAYGVVAGLLAVLAFFAGRRRTPALVIAVLFSVLAAGVGGLFALFDPIDRPMLHEPFDPFAATITNAWFAALAVATAWTAAASLRRPSAPQAATMRVAR